jgi:hypothetical protein
MNQRIRQLAEQAGLISKQDDRENWQEYINDVEKFAELIIMECSQVCIERASQYQVNHLITDEAIFCSLRIKDHFGDAGYTRRPRGWTRKDEE